MGPHDGIVLFRPVTQPKPVFFAQLGFGVSFTPLHTSDITRDQVSLGVSSSAAIAHQFTQYTTVGAEFLDRFAVALTLPLTYFQDGQNPVPSNPLFNTAPENDFKSGGPT